MPLNRHFSEPHDFQCQNRVPKFTLSLSTILLKSLMIATFAGIPPSLPAAPWSFQWKTRFNSGTLPVLAGGPILLSNYDRDAFPELVFSFRRLFPPIPVTGYRGVIAWEFQPESSYTFTAQDSLFGPYNVHHLGDVNFNGLYDLVVQRGHGINDFVAIFEQPTPYAFPSVMIDSQPSPTTVTEFIAIHFADNDSLVDISVRPYFYYKIWEFKPEVDSFAEIFSLPDSIAYGFGPKITGDFDLDGLREVLFARPAYGIGTWIRIYEVAHDDHGHPLDDSFQLVYDTTFTDPGGGWNIDDAVFIPDMDGNGYPEIALTTYQTLNGSWPPLMVYLYILEAHGDNQYTIRWKHAWYNNEEPMVPGPLGRSSVGDLDGDGQPELAFSEATRVRILKYTHEGDSLMEVAFLNPPIIRSEIRTFCYDFDQNGIDELLVFGDSLWWIGESGPFGTGITLVYEKKISMEWLFPGELDSILPPDSTYMLRWQVWDPVAVESVYVSSILDGEDTTLLYAGVAPGPQTLPWTPDSIGTYQFMLVCTGPGIPPRNDTAFSRPVWITAVEENKVSPPYRFDLRVSPFMSGSQFRIRVSVPRGQTGQLEVYGVDGRRLQVLASSIQGFYEKTWRPDPTHFPPGVYFLRLYTHSREKTIKLVYLGPGGRGRF